MRNVTTPLGSIVPNEVAALSRQQRSAGNASRSVRPVESHANHQAGWVLRAQGGRLQLQHGLVGGQKQTVSSAPGEELDLSSALTLIRLEEQRQRLQSKHVAGGRLGTAGFGGIDGGGKTRHDACGREHRRCKKCNLHPISSVCFHRTSHRTYYRHGAIPIHEAPPISQFRGVRHEWHTNNRGLDALKEADAYLSPELGIKPTNTFTSNTYAVKPDGLPGRIVRSRKRCKWLQDRRRQALPLEIYFFLTCRCLSLGVCRWSLASVRHRTLPPTND